MSLFPMTRMSDPFSDLDRMFDLFMSDGLATRNLTKNLAKVPRANVINTENGYAIELAAPGFSRGDFNIDVNDNVLTVSVTCEDGPEYVKNLRSREFSYESFSRSWSLSKGVMIDGIEAHYEAGILSVSIPAETKKSMNRTIDVS